MEIHASEDHVEAARDIGQICNRPLLSKPSHCTLAHTEARL